jgi:general secretion pathway protein K
MSRPGRGARTGMVLLNVLIVVAISAAAVTVMIVAQDIQVRRTIRLHDAAQAQSYARAGELSAITALRRDALTTPDVDVASEPWAQIGQTAVAIPNGGFALSIADEQARFNVNALALGEPIPAGALLEIARLTGVSRETVSIIEATVLALGPIRDDGPLRAAGVDPEDLARLAPLVVFLPPEAKLNVNTADPALLEMILRDPAAVRRVLARRSAGGLSAEEAAGLGAGGLFTASSAHFRVTTDVRVGAVRRLTVSRVSRSEDAEGRPRVTVTARRRLTPPS